MTVQIVVVLAGVLVTAGLAWLLYRAEAARPGRTAASGAGDSDGGPLVAPLGAGTHAHHHGHHHGHHDAGHDDGGGGDSGDGGGGDGGGDE